MFNCDLNIDILDNLMSICLHMIFVSVYDLQRGRINFEMCIFHINLYFFFNLRT